MTDDLPTPQELYSRLRGQSSVTSDEYLARDLGIRIGILNRLKRGEGTQYDTTIKLLAAAAGSTVTGLTRGRFCIGLRAR